MKEVAKFFSRLAPSQVLIHGPWGHGAMAISGTRFSVFGLDYTPELNMVAAVVWAILVVLLANYAWVRCRSDIGRR